MECRIGCAACCIEASISSPLPGLPAGKPAGMACPHLDEEGRCRIWGTPAYPAVCRDFTPTAEICGRNREEALANLRDLEAATAVDPGRP